MKKKVERAMKGLRRGPLGFARPLLASVILALASPMVTASVLVDIGTDATNSYVWNTSYTVGYDITVGGTSQQINALGIFDTGGSPSATPAGVAHTNADGLLASHDVGIWDSGGTLVASATVNPGDPTFSSASIYGDWVYTSIAPVVLAANATYTVGGLFTANNPDSAMVFQNTVITTGVAFNGGRYIAGGTLAQPTAPCCNQLEYFGPTLLNIPSPPPGIPEPGTITLFALGLISAGFAARRRNAL